MGYAIQTVESYVYIEQENWEKLAEFLNTKDPAEALRHIGYLESVTYNKGILEIEAVDSRIHAFKSFMKIITPFIEDKANFHILGEDGEHWLWEIKDGKITYHYAIITFSEEGEVVNVE